MCFEVYVSSKSMEVQYKLPNILRVVGLHLISQEILNYPNEPIPLTFSRTVLLLMEYGSLIIPRSEDNQKQQLVLSSNQTGKHSCNESKYSPFLLRAFMYCFISPYLIIKGVKIIRSLYSCGTSLTVSLPKSKIFHGIFLSLECPKGKEPGSLLMQYTFKITLQ